MICGRKPITAPHHHAGPPAPMTCHPRAGTPIPHTNQPASQSGGRPRTQAGGSLTIAVTTPGRRASARPAGCAHYTHAPPLLAISDNEPATANSSPLPAHGTSPTCASYPGPSHASHGAYSSPRCTLRARVSTNEQTPSIDATGQAHNSCSGGCHQ